MGQLTDMLNISTDAIRPPKNDDDEVYPCMVCATLRSKNQEGTTFTVCDTCWDKKHTTGGGM